MGGAWQSEFTLEAKAPETPTQKTKRSTEEPQSEVPETPPPKRKRSTEEPQSTEDGGEAKESGSNDKCSSKLFTEWYIEHKFGDKGPSQAEFQRMNYLRREYV